MRRTAPPKRKKPPRRRNPKRAAKLFRRNFGSSAYVEAIHRVPCIVRGSPNATPCRGPAVCMHRRARRAGDGWPDIVAACDGHHMESHKGIETFAEKYELDLEAASDELVATYGHLTRDDVPL